MKPKRFDELKCGSLFYKNGNLYIKDRTNVCVNLRNGYTRILKEGSVVSLLKRKTNISLRKVG